MTSFSANNASALYIKIYTSPTIQSSGTDDIECCETFFEYSVPKIEPLRYDNVCELHDAEFSQCLPPKPYIQAQYLAPCRQHIESSSRE